jgi:hypothetical protein
MIAESKRFQILTILGLGDADELALWAKLDAVELRPAKEAHLLALLDKALLVDGQRLLQVTEEAGLEKARDVEFDPLQKCRSIGEGESLYKNQIADLIGWVFPEPATTSSPWF